MVRPNETRQYVHDPRRYQSRLRLPNGVQEVSVWQEPRAERGFFFAGPARHRAALRLPNLVREAKRLRRRSPKGHQRSLRDVAVELERDYLSRSARQAGL